MNFPGDHIAYRPGCWADSGIAMPRNNYSYKMFIKIPLVDWLVIWRGTW